MKITIPTTSTDLKSLIIAQHGTATLQLIESKRIKWDVLWNYWVELQYLDWDFFAETVLDTAVLSECRAITEDTGAFAFNAYRLENVYIIWTDGSFILSIV